MLQCLKYLEMSSQPSDQVLVQAVKVQHLEEGIRRLNDDLPSFDATEDEANIARIIGLRNDWELLSQSSSELMHNPLVASHIKTAFLRLHEPLKQTSHIHPNLSSPPPIPTSNLLLHVASSTGSSSFPTSTNSEYQDYELGFDVDVEMAGPPTRGMQYGGHDQSQDYRQQMQGQQWAAAGAQGWPEENAGAVMFWGAGTS
ncbi:hypothetical protein B0T13DRAFT_223454 [Neurospora crassa]|nr:hypothetical protein B0T13DRAFT_223454 [Neurospora crassa]